MIAYNTVILIICALLLVSIFRSREKNPEKTDIILNKNSTVVLRGAAILFIALHHFSQYYDSLGFLQGPLKQSGYAFTAVFFFFSGYGCFFSLKKYSELKGRKKFNAASAWFFKHSLRIYFDFIIIYLLDIIALYLLRESGDLTLSSVLKGAVTVTLPGWVCWYPKIQILCYFILSVAFLISDKRKTVITLIATVFYIAIAWFMKLPSMWFTSVICFPIGCIFAGHIPHITFSRKTLYAVFAASSIVFGFLFIAQYKWNQALFRTVSVIFLPLIIASVTGLFGFKSKILTAVGNMSFEIYLIHLVVLHILIQDSIKNSVNSNAALLIILASSLLVGWVTNKAVVRFTAVLFPGKAKQKEEQKNKVQE